MIYRIFADKDTFVTNGRARSVQQTGSNFGSSEILHLYKKTNTDLTSSLARIIMKFDVDGALSVVSSSARYYLKMSDAVHDNTLPSSFDIEVQALSQDWDEGRGHDVDLLTDKGFANWDKCKSNVWWTTPGASGSGPIVPLHFDAGDEDVNVDVTDVVALWISGTIDNNGLMVKMSSTIEDDTSDYYIKMFHGRSTSFLDKRPVLEARWDDSILSGSVTLASDVGPFVVNVTNLKNEYENDETAILRVFIRKEDHNPAVLLTASLSSALSLAVSASYYRVTNDRTGETVIPFGTGSVKTTRLSYDDTGNYFKLYLSSLAPGNIYRLAFLFDVGGQRQLVDEGFKFRTV